MKKEFLFYFYVILTSCCFCIFSCSPEKDEEIVEEPVVKDFKSVNDILGGSWYSYEVVDENHVHSYYTDDSIFRFYADGTYTCKRKITHKGTYTFSDKTVCIENNGSKTYYKFESDGSYRYYVTVTTISTKWIELWTFLPD